MTRARRTGAGPPPESPQNRQPLDAVSQPVAWCRTVPTLSAVGDTQNPPGVGTSRADLSDPMMAPNRRMATASPDGARK
jgi:hypothetical protein